MNAPRHSTRKAAGLVSVAVMTSRVMGLVRELVFAGMFGAGKFLDAYIAAFQIPNLLRDLFAEGALSTAFTTTFTRTWEKEGPRPAWILANLLITAVIVVLGSICLLGIIGAPLIVDLTNHGYLHFPGKFELTVRLTRILFPFILFVSLAAVVMGILNSRFIFGLPASASTMFNLVSVIGAIGFAYWLDPQSSWRHPHFTAKALDGICLGTLLGGLAQLAIQLPSLWKLGFRFRWHFNLRDDRLKEVWSLMLPSVIAGAAVQVNVLINGNFASDIDGARSWLNCAFRLMQFPIGVFGVAIATVTLPAVAREQARADLGAFGQTVEKSLRLTFFLTIPSAIGLAVMAEPIIRAIYQHGLFLASSTHQTALALQAYVAGLAAYSAIKVVVPCFYALKEPQTPLRISLFGIAFNLVMNFTLMKILRLGHVGLACTTSAIAIVNLLQLLVALQKHINLGESVRWLDFLLRVSGASIVCGGTAFALNEIFNAWSHQGFWPGILALTATVIPSAAMYFAMSKILHIEEIELAWSMVKRKLKLS